ncbi:MAG TPA: outer membrane beta-barrel protein [Terracidiphilus sp.]|jgi:opacity protein-like surface antigen|nr:outer membrane beta-barrel protein [Terracidiphilus sp.]
MRIRLIPAILALLIFAGLACRPAFAQTDVALSLYGAFTGTTDASGYTQSPSNSAGGLVELRHISNPVVGFEATYSFNGSNQAYKANATCGLSCGNVSAATVKADAHEVTVDWVPSVKLLHFRPFGVLGAGLLLNVPQSGQTSASTQTSTKPVYVYGAGLDWGLVPHIGLRLQYRGNLYKAPDVTSIFTSADKFTHTAEPMIGIYFRL